MDNNIFLTKQEECIEHSFVDMIRYDNGCSCWGTKICQKCGVKYNWQDDYNLNNYSIRETKPY